MPFLLLFTYSAPFPLEEPAYGHYATVSSQNDHRGTFLFHQKNPVQSPDKGYS